MNTLTASQLKLSYTQVSTGQAEMHRNRSIICHSEIRCVWWLCGHTLIVAAPCALQTYRKLAWVTRADKDIPGFFSIL